VSGTLRTLADARWRLTPGAYRRVTLAAVIALSLIVVTGGAVRLTGSGLGCPDWPTCTGHRIVAAWSLHPMIEFTNRVITVAVTAAVVAAVLGALVRRPRRRDLVWLSSGLVAGVLAQIVLGGLTVLYKLDPPWVMGHFVLSFAVLADAVVLHYRAGRPDTPARPVVSRDLVRLGRLVLATVGVVVILGTAVTGSGPHSGDIHAKRLPFHFQGVAELHSSVVMVLVGLTIASLFALHHAHAPADVQRRARIVLGVIAAQAAIGYTQYFTRVPAALVAVHLAGATVLWIAVLRYNLGLFVHPAPEGRPLDEQVVPGDLAEDVLAGA
jgi:cytochrome c oxidase assembly protein subunit 15